MAKATSPQETTTQTKRKPAAPATRGRRSQTAAARSGPDHDIRLRMIAEAAYYRAEKRGFAPGFEDSDWLAAESEINTQYS